jgi:diguanylate cyclase (GGDEF)-like protein
MALRDSLTGLANREQFHRQLQAALATALRLEKKVALLMLDVDNFKDVNDTLGHPVGDQLLREVSQRLLRCCRETDTVARLGGDEFAVIATHLQSPDGAAILARRMVDALQEPVILEGREVHISGSIGITLYPTDGLDPADLQKNADLALYRAKDNGKNSFQFYDEEMHDTVQRRKSMERDLRVAIAAGAFELHYQPQIDLNTQTVIGAEALIRWPHPEQGTIPPLDFIPLAEATGLIVPLGEWVLRTACQQMADWRDAGLHLPRLSVNLSGVQLNKSPIIDVVKRVIEETGIAGEDLELELTESTVMENVEAVIPILEHIHELGVSVAIDDFGTGYSSLSYLKRLPVDKLKIDRSFVSDVTTSEDDAAIAQAITSLAKTLRLDVIAEGVETEEQMLFLRRIGCDAAQGYYISRPLPPQAFADWLRKVGK